MVSAISDLLTGLMKNRKKIGMENKSERKGEKKRHGKDLGRQNLIFRTMHYVLLHLVNWHPVVDPMWK